MRKNTKRLIALLMTITMILAVCPVEIFAAGDDTAVSAVPAAVTDSADTAEDTLAPEEASASEDVTVTESEAPVSAEQSEAAASQQTSANAAALQKSSGLLPAPVFQKYYRGSVAASYITAAVFEGEGTAEQPYLITSSADWDALSSAINSGSTAYAGKHFQLTQNITVTTMLGYRPGNTDNDDYVFSGTFDGAGHTLNVNINTSLGFAAPFAIAHNAVIKNLKVTGTVTSTGFHATGLVGASKAKVNADESSLTIQNVTVSTDVSCTSHIAGIIGHAHQADITMENVVFDGSLNASSVQGGFIGWGGAIHGFNASFKDCLFAGTYKSGVAFHPIAFASGQGTVTLINDFYTTKAPSGGNPITPTGSGSLKIKTGTRLISSASDWNEFADAVLAGETFENYLVKLTDDITVTRGIGSAIIESATAPVYPFSGTFDGCGHTLNFVPPADTEANYVAPFSIVKNATVTNLKVTGKVTAYNNISGLVGSLIGTLLIENVISDVDVSGNFVGGFIGHGSAGNITVRNSAYTGDLNGSTLAGGIICWRGPIAWDPSGVSAVHMENCLFAGRATGTADFHPIGFTQQTNVPSGFTNMWSSVSPKNNSKGFYNYQYQGASYKPTVAVVTSNSDTSGTRPWMGYYDVTAFPPTEGALAEALNAWTGAEKLFLLGDVTTNSTITVPTGSHTLDLNGYGILITGNSRVITINKDASLKLNDSNPDRIHYITLTDYRGTAVSDSGESSVSNGNGIIQVKGGYLTGGYLNNTGSHDKCGAGVFNWGTFVMNGGNIVGNTMLNNSGAGIRNSGFFTMNSGKIAFNKATANGGGVTTYVPGGSQGKMTMNAGEISDNYCGKYGGGIQLAGPLELTGGAIVRNTADMGGSGIYYSGKGDRFKISGEPIIKDNLNDNLFLDTDATFMISGSLAEDAEIGILMKNNAVFTVGWKDNMGAADPSECFTSDNSNYAVILNSSGEAEIGVPPAARIISGEVTTNYGSISDAVGAWTAGSTLKLLSDVTTNSTITVPAGSHTLDLNGHTLKAGSAGYSVVTVGSGAALVIDDTAGGGKITGGSVGQNYGGGITVDGGKLTLQGGTISGNANTYSGIGNCGGGIHVKNSGKFYMEGGEISGNTSYVGGGVCSDGSATTVSITGGVIKNNTTERFASAIWAGRTDNATFLIGGDANIVDNISTWTSDKNGEASVNFSKLSISGNPTVRGCWKTTGNSAPNAHINLDNDGSSVQRIALDGALTNESGTPNLLLSPIYRWNDLQSGKTFVFTSGWSTYMGTAHPADYFGVDASVSGVRIIRKDGEAAFTGSSDLGDLYITYNANGGTGEMDAQLVSTTSAVLNQNSFSNGNKEFIGWNTKADGSGTPYGDKGDITLSGDVTLYAQWAEKHAHDDIDFKIWTSTTSLPTKAGEYYLGADVTISSTWNVPTGTVNLCLNGHGIKMVGSGSVINVGSSAVLNVYDCGETEHKFTVNSPASNGAGCAIVNDSLAGDYKTFTGGYITGGNAQDGAGVYVTGGGKFNMYGGTILGNLASRHGGGVNVSMSNDGSEFNLYGGSVCYNSAIWGGGINAFATARVCGEGLVANNVASNGGGGIELESGAILYMNGGTVTGNRVLTQNGGMWKGGGVHVPNGTQFHISGNVRVTDNYQNSTGTVQSNVFVRKEVPGKVILDGALGSDASLGIGTNGTVPFTLTTDYNTFMGEVEPGKYFTSDSENYIVERSSAGEAEIGVPPVASIISGETTTSYVAFDAAVSAWLNSSDGATLKLLKDVSYTDKIILSNSKKLVLDLNGKTYTRAVPSGDGTVFDVNSGANFTLTDTSEEQTGVVTRQSGNFGGTVLFVRDSGSVINYDGGKLTGFTSRVIISWQGSTVNMSGGEISGNNLINGDATDGIVRTYSSTSEPGGTFNMTGGKIINNTLDSGKTGGAVYVGNNGTFNISGNVEISGNTQDGKPKNVYLPTGTTMNVTGALGEDALICVTLQNGTGVITNGWKDTMGDADLAKYFTSDNADYTVILKDGEAALEYPPVPDVSASGYTGDYDGAAHSIAVSVPTGATVQYGTKAGEYSLTENPSYTGAGTYNVYYKVTMDKHTPVEGSAVVTINQIDVTVTITGHNTTVNFDGKAHSADGYDFAADTTLYTAADFTFSGRAEAARTDAGTTQMGLAASQFANTNDNFDTVTFNVSDGFVKINPIDVTVTITGHNVTANYDAKAHSAEGYDFAADTALYTEADFTFSGSAAAERTDAGKTAMELAASQFENTNDNFDTVTFNVSDGFVKINPINVTVTITGHNVTANYDAKAHSAEGYNFAADSTLYTEADFTFSGTAAAERTDAGKTDMGLTAAQFSNTNPNFATVTFHVTDGFVKIDPIDVTVTITGHRTTVDFDANTHSADGYDFAADNALYTAADFTFDGRAEALRTNAGTTQMGLAASQFENTNKNFATVVFNVTDGFVKVNQINAVVTITGQHLTADYDGNTHSVAGYAFESDTPLYTAAYVTFSGNAAAERREAGTTQMGLAAAQFENTNENFATVTFNVTDGYVTINPITAVVSVTGHTNTAPYNGKAHIVSGYDASANTALYDVEKDFAFTGSANAVQTDAGTAKMGLSSAQFKNTNPNFASVIFKVTDGWQKITRVDASIKSAPHAKNNLVYNGDTQALIVPGTAVGGTMYYAIGANDTTVPAGAQFKQTLPAAKEVGNYYIWYKVAADKNHNSLAPKCFKVTLAEPAWESISGKILNNDNTPAPGAKVILMRGNEVVDTITSNENGEYYFTVPKGVYNMVVKVNGVTVTNIADVTGNVNSDITLPAPNTDSVLDIVSSDKSIAVGGLEQEANLIRQNEKVPDDVNVTVKMTVQAIAESDTDGSKAITSFAKDKYIEFYNLSVEKTVGSVTTKMNTTQTVMEIVIPCSFTNKRELQVFTCDGGDVTALTESDSGEPGTYRVDTENGLIYIYTTSFATVALAYQPYFSVTSFLSLGSYTGNVSVKLEKESGDKIFELNDVSVEDIAFKGVPRGTYIMTIQWVDGAENTITMLFNIK